MNYDMNLPHRGEYTKLQTAHNNVVARAKVKMVISGPHGVQEIDLTPLEAARLIGVRKNRWLQDSATVVRSAPELQQVGA